MRSLFIALLISAKMFASDIYFAPTAQGANNGTSAANAYAYNDGTHGWNVVGNWVAGNNLHVCNQGGGTYTGALNSTIMTAAGSGSSGSPITIVADCGTVTLTSPAWNGTNAGAINISSRSWITFNGQGNLTIINSANGDGLANQQISQGIYANGCSNCIIENTIISNIYVAIQNFGSPLGGSATQMNAIVINGSNWTLTGNTVHDCGWCLYIVPGSGDTNNQIYSNEIYNWDHGILYAMSSAVSCTAPCLFLHDNKIHDNINWETAGCVYHLDGIHFFGVVGSTMNGVYMYNNHWYGSLSGACSSGFVFQEQGSPSQTNASNVYIWNEVYDASNANGVNPNGWVGVFGTIGGVLQMYNNTLLCPSSTDNSTVGWNLSENTNAANITFENNLENKCPQGMNLRQGTGTLTMDYNYYGNPCASTSNCWVWAGTTFEGSFSAWKTACSCDSHSATTASDAALHLNSDGSLQSNSPAIKWGNNFASAANGNLSTLANDTTEGGTRSTNARPSSGNCITQGTSTPCWDDGAFQFAAASAQNGITLQGVVDKGTVAQ